MMSFQGLPSFSQEVVWRTFLYLWLEDIQPEEQCSLYYSPEQVQPLTYTRFLMNLSLIELQTSEAHGSLLACLAHFIQWMPLWRTLWLSNMSISCQDIELAISVYSSLLVLTGLCNISRIQYLHQTQRLAMSEPCQRDVACDPCWKEVQQLGANCYRWLHLPRKTSVSPYPRDKRWSWPGWKHGFKRWAFCWGGIQHWGLSIAY